MRIYWQKSLSYPQIEPYSRIYPQKFIESRHWDHRYDNRLGHSPGGTKSAEQPSGWAASPVWEFRSRVCWTRCLQTNICCEHPQIVKAALTSIHRMPYSWTDGQDYDVILAVLDTIYPKFRHFLDRWCNHMRYVWLIIGSSSTAAGEKPGQRLKKLAQAKPEGLLHLFVLTLANFPTWFFIWSLFFGSTENSG